LTRKNLGYKGGQLITEALNAYQELKRRLITDPVVAYPRRTSSLFLDSKAVWIRLNDENNPRTALW